MSSSSQRQANSYSRRAPFHDDTNNQSSFRNQPNRNEPPLNRGRGYVNIKVEEVIAMPNRGDLDAQNNRNDGYNDRRDDGRGDKNKRFQHPGRSEEQPKYFDGVIENRHNTNHLSR